MTAKDKATLKAYFNTGDIPTESNFTDLIDTIFVGTWTDYSSTSTIVGWTSYTTKKISYGIDGGFLFVQYSIVGTSNAISASFTMPELSAVGFNFRYMGISIDNGGTAVPGKISITNNSNACTLSPTLDGGSWTSSGTKTCQGQFWLKV